ncbi:MAG: hypothetical protein LBU32_03480 [Clostridiales bacterium]|nr:hypothetical protein [Clostridiales bacterium]
MQAQRRKPDVSTPAAVRARGGQGASGGGARRAGHRGGDRRGEAAAGRGTEHGTAVRRRGSGISPRRAGRRMEKAARIAASP